MGKYIWHNDRIDNFYCFEIDGWVLCVEQLKKGGWSSIATKSAVKHYCQTFSDCKEAKEAAINYALNYYEILL